MGPAEGMGMVRLVAFDLDGWSGAETNCSRALERLWRTCSAEVSTSAT